MENVDTIRVASTEGNAKIPGTEPWSQRLHQESQ